MSTAESFAWAAIVLCIVATVQIAVHYAQENSRLFASLVFFALHWAFLLPYWGLRGQGNLPRNLIDMVELLPVFSGFLLTLSAGPLRREATIRLAPGAADPGTSKLDRWVLRGLYLTMMSHIPFIPGLFSDEVHFILIVLLGAGFTIFGFWSILEALGRMAQGSGVPELNHPRLPQLLTRLTIWIKTRPRPVQVLVGITVLYTIVELFFTILLLMHREGQWIAGFEYTYGILKMAFSSAFLYAIYRDVYSRRPKVIALGTAP